MGESLEGSVWAVMGLFGRLARPLLRAFDPEGMKEAKKMLNGVVWCESAYDTMPDGDCVVIVTEWNEFRALDLEALKKAMRGNVLVDLRNIFQAKDAEAAGFSYSSIGRGA